MTIISNLKGAMLTINQGLQRLGYWDAIANDLIISCHPILAQILPDST
jgi:hypothetical protein